MGGKEGIGLTLSSLSVLERLSSERSLVDLTLGRTRERKSVVLELTMANGKKSASRRVRKVSSAGSVRWTDLEHGLWCLPAHVVDRVLVSEPIGSLDGVVHVPSPVVLGHVSEGGVDASLGGDRVRSGRKQLGDARSVESSLGKSEGG